jgi:large subunit ribosomal protein L30
MSTIKITLTKSGIHCPVRQKKTLHALGLTHLYKTVEHKETAQINGMISIIRHLVTIENAKSN